MKKDSDKHQSVGVQNAKSAIPWQVLIAGTVYILDYSRVWNKRTSLNKRSPWKIWQKE